MNDEILDVIQIGYGPCGKAFAALAGKAGIRMAVFERYPEPYTLPRATSLDHETMRIFQSLGCADQIAFDAIIPDRYVCVNKAHETLMEIDFSGFGVSGWGKYNTYQPEIENALDAVARRNDCIEIHHGWEAIDLRQETDHVAVTLRAVHDSDAAIPPRQRIVRARYVVAADGGNSFVRRHLGFEIEDLGFSQDWLVIDFRIKRRHPRHQVNMQMCDPERPHSLVAIGQRHRRFSFYVKSGERDQPLTSERAWSLVAPYINPDDAELIRQTVYLFQSKVVKRWRDGRVFLLGDAAHLMPPYMGQGMCSGVRDAANLAWKLALVLQGTQSDRLLDTYDAERRPHVREWTERSAALGKFVCMVDPEEARKRDELLLSGFRPPRRPEPNLTSGLLDPGCTGSAAGVVGRLGPQGQIARQGKTGLADDLVGNGWQLIARVPVEGHLSAEAKVFADTLALRYLEVGAAGAGLSAADLSGAYGEYFNTYAVNVILVRPDLYVFGSAVGADEVSGLLLRLKKCLAEF